MTIHIHHLTGCSPTPLAYYLKALGILRLIAEQKDPNARGWWQDEAFHLASTLSRNELEYFFLEEYAPTPIIDPWNGGSGFYPNDKKAGITFLLNSLAPRFSSYQSAIRDGIDLVGNRKDAPKKTEKERMLTNARQLWRGPRLEMMAAAIVLTANGSPAYAALCGTGWNDGRLDFANNFMQRVADLYEGSSGKPKKHSVQLLDCAMWMLPVNGLSKKIAIGQYLPGGAGGANSTTGPDGDSLVNPWDFILMLEGAVLFSASVVGRTTLKAPSAAAAPFSIHPAASGFASASKAEEDSPRGEQWMPIWNQPSTLMDLKLLMADGRARLGRATASRPVDFARAVARLGVARGIVSFQRFGYLERNGQSNLAVPLGRWQVCPQPQQDLLNDLDTWLSPLQRACREKNAPASLGYAHRRLENAILGVCAHGSEASRWQVVLLGLADIEQQLVTSGKFTTEKRLQPILPLSAGWIDAANDGSPEFRLARS